MVLADLKLELKSHFTENIMEAFEEMEKLMDLQGEKYNTVLMFKGRLKLISTDSMLGTIS